MKKILFTLLFILFLIPTVNALTRIEDPFEYGASILPQSCSDNILKLSFSNLQISSGYWWYLDESDLSSTQPRYFVSDYIVEIEPSTDYYYYSDMGATKTFYVNFFDVDFNYLSYVNIVPNTKFTSPSGGKYIAVGLYTTPSKLKSEATYAHMINKGTSKLDYVDYEQCPVITADTTLDNFYSIYVSKLKEFSEYALENKYILGTLAIIILFIILEIILNLFRKGGFR